jgi:hypothetical protein
VALVDGRRRRGRESAGATHGDGRGACPCCLAARTDAGGTGGTGSSACTDAVLRRIAIAGHDGAR